MLSLRNYGKLAKWLRRSVSSLARDASENADAVRGLVRWEFHDSR
jgi:hypothetical protein